jgi:hypothetical protein
MVHTALDHNLDVLTASCAEAGPPSVTNLSAVPPALPASAFDACPFSHPIFSPSCEKLLVSWRPVYVCFARTPSKINQPPPPTDSTAKQYRPSLNVLHPGYPPRLTPQQRQFLFSLCGHESRIWLHPPPD